LNTETKEQNSLVKGNS